MQKLLKLFVDYNIGLSFSKFVLVALEITYCCLLVVVMYDVQLASISTYAPFQYRFEKRSPCTAGRRKATVVTYGYSTAQFCGVTSLSVQKANVVSSQRTPKKRGRAVHSIVLRLKYEGMEGSREKRTCIRKMGKLCCRNEISRLFLINDASNTVWSDIAIQATLQDASFSMMCSIPSRWHFYMEDSAVGSQ